MIIILRKILLACFLIILASCSTNEDKGITIAFTSDVHGTIFSKYPANGKERKTSMSKVSSYLKTLDSEKLLLLDNGDNLQGAPDVYYYNFEDTESEHLWSAVLNYLNYDAVNVGNHDIEAGHSVYDRIAKSFDMPMLAANAIDSESGKPYFKPYTIIQKNGVKVAVLGLITPGVPSWLPEVLYKGIEFEDMVESAQKWMPEIISLNPDLVLGLFHAGWDATYGGFKEGAYLNQNASLEVARKVSGFDIILLGHDHDLMSKIVINEQTGDSVLIFDGASHTRFLPIIDVRVSGKKRSRVVTISHQNIKTDTLEADPEFDKLFDKQYNDVSTYIKRKIGSLENSISSRQSYFGDSKFMDLIHTVQLETAEADISFAAPLSFNVQIDSGDIFVSDMFDLYRFENMLYTIELTGNEIDKYLEFSTSMWFNTVNSSNSKVLKYKNNSSTNFLNRYYNFDSAAGIIYEINVSKNDGDKVAIISMADGSKFSSDKTYTVAVNSFRGSGGGGHLKKGCGLSDADLKDRLIKSTEKDLRYYMIKWFEKKGNVLQNVDNNWKLVPEHIVSKTVSNEYNTLFKKN